MLTARDACARAKEYQATVRGKDAANVLGISPLLAGRDLTPLPSSAEAGKVSRQICGDRRRDVQAQFMEYHHQVVAGHYAPPVPRTGSPPLPYSCLPGGVAILDHVQALAESQDSTLSGGSFLPFIEGTLELCAAHRQPSANPPAVRTLVFPESSDAQILSFIREFNDMIAAAEAPAHGFLPHSFFHFDVEGVSSYPECGFQIIPEGLDPLRIQASTQPARIHLGHFSKRFDIVIPWRALHIGSDYRGAYRLRVPSLRVSTLWHSLFSKLRGVAIGIGLDSDLRNLSEFFEHFFPADKFGPIRVKTADLEVLLAFAGFNSTRTNISALNYFFTGGFIVKHWEVRCGFGQWGSTAQLPPTLNLYLQSEAIGVLNTALVCLCCILLHWFVTPGIAAVVSRKTPAKFLGWFARFWSFILGEFRVPAADQFSTSGDRANSPKRMLRNLVPARSASPVFTADALAECAPSWRAITGGGCPSDQLAFDHLLNTVWPLLASRRVPFHLRWESDIKVVTGFLSGRPSPSARQWSGNFPGCRPDSSLLEVPALVPLSRTHLAPLRDELKVFKDSLPDGHIQRTLSLAQLLLSFTWQHPVETFEMFQRQVALTKKHFVQRDFDLLRPLVVAYFPEAAEFDGPAAYTRFKAARSQRAMEKRLARLATVLTASSNPAERVTLRRKIRDLRKAVAASERTVVLATNDISRVQYDPASPTPTASPTSPTPEEAELVQEEIRRVTYRDTSPPPISDDELVITTAEWDQL